MKKSKDLLKSGVLALCLLTVGLPAGYAVAEPTSAISNSETAASTPAVEQTSSQDRDINFAWGILGLLGLLGLPGLRRNKAS